MREVCIVLKQCCQLVATVNSRLPLRSFDWLCYKNSAQVLASSEMRSQRQKLRWGKLPTCRTAERIKPYSYHIATHTEKKEKEDRHRDTNVLNCVSKLEEHVVAGLNCHSSENELGQSISAAQIRKQTTFRHQFSFFLAQRGFEWRLRGQWAK